MTKTSILRQNTAFLGLIAAVLAFEPSSAIGASSLVDCVLQYLKLSRTEAPAPNSPKIENLDDLLRAFSHGLVPDLSDASQRNAFELYRKMRFGDPNTNLTTGTLNTIAKEIKAHPELEKEQFRNIRIESQVRVYPVTPELKQFLDSQTKSLGQVKSNLFQIEANAGYWKKVLQYAEPTGEMPKEEAKAFFAKFLDERIPPSVRAEIANSELPAKARAKKLFEILKQERENRASEGKDARPVSQAMVDLIHTIGFHDPAILKDLKSTDGMVRLAAFRRAMDERDSFAMELGFENHFVQVLSDYHIQIPTGVDSVKELPEKLSGLEQGVRQNSQIVQNASSAKTVRHLSITESPFRSCLGGSDCSSRTYLTRALDPNYHYFTLTDETGASSGHITVALGEAKRDGKSVKMAFIDKVQNVPDSELPAMTEGVRQSVSEKGYVLALPEDLGGLNGISNVAATGAFIKRAISTDPTRQLTDFTLHGHPYRFENRYSRADARLPSRPVLPFSQEGIHFMPAEVDQPWKVKTIDLKKLVQSSIALKHGSPEDKLRYIPSMKIIEKAGLKSDPDFESTLQTWLKDPSEPIQLRKQVLLHEWAERSKPLSSILDSFSPQEQINLIQNFLETPRYRDLILKDKGLVDLIVRVRSSKKVRGTLLDSYAGAQKEKIAPWIDEVLDARDIGTDRATTLVKAIKSSLGSSDIEEMLKISSAAAGTSLEHRFNDALPLIFVANVPSDLALGRTLARSLNSSDSAVRAFGSQIIEKAPSLSNLPGVQVFHEIASLQQTHPELKDFSSAARTWMGKDDVDPTLKAKFLLMHYGASDAHGGSLYREYEHLIPASQREKVLATLERETNLSLYEKRVGTDPALRSFLEKVKIEAFQFNRFDFPSEGKKFEMGSPATEAGRGRDEALREVTLKKSFEMQATPVTQAQWAVVMGENPSSYKKEGQRVVRINGQKIQTNPNRPVEHVSWDDAQKFIQKLNELDPHYTYSLPTEAQWEYAARAGTKTAYSFGDNAAELSEHVWHSGNSGSQPHEVAELKPNANGLYDMHGNVWEWVQDRYDTSPPAGIDPTGPPSGSARVLRGGSWNDDARVLRSAQRGSTLPVNRNSFIGFRLVRTPK